MNDASRKWSINNVITETLFPGIDFKTIPAARMQRLGLGQEVVTSLPLQMLVYFNILFFPCWGAVLIVVFNVKFEHMDFLNRYIYLTVLTGAILMEAVRLYIGYVGNLREDVPDLAGFWLITLLLACPLHGILLFNPASLRLAAEMAVVFPQVALVAVQLIVGYGAVSQLARHQVKKFHAQNAIKAEQREQREMQRKLHGEIET